MNPIPLALAPPKSSLFSSWWCQRARGFVGVFLFVAGAVLADPPMRPTMWGEEAIFQNPVTVHLEPVAQLAALPPPPLPDNEHIP